MKTMPVALLAVLALTACDSGAPDEAPPEATPPTETDGGLSLPSGTEEAIPDETSSMSDIPMAMRGRWGLVAADCDPGRDDAKGLMIVGPRQLEFYESVGTLDEITDSGGTRIRATFDFSGEGMTWERELSLELQAEGNALVREEFGEDAAPDPLRYEKCEEA